MTLQDAVFYVATGQTYREEAGRSARTARHFVGATPIILITDQSFVSSDFDETIVMGNPKFDFSDKIRGLLSFPYRNGILLDTDTFVCGDIIPLFSLLEKFDIAASHASWRFSPQLNGKIVVKEAYRRVPIPDCFPDFNTGVIVFRKSPDVTDFFYEWQAIYAQQCCDPLGAPANDQPAFTEAVWNSHLRVYVIPPEYNCRIDFPVYVGSDVRICHGRNDRVADISHIINSGRGARAYVPEANKVFDSASFDFSNKATP